MKSVSTLNRVTPRRLPPLILFVLGVMVSVGALWMQLAVIYTRPAPFPAPPARLPAGLPAEAATVPAGEGFQPMVLRQGLLLVRGPARPIGQQHLSLCDQSADSASGPLMAPLYVGWDWSRLLESAAANRAARPPRPADAGLKNSLLDDGPGGVDIPAFAVTSNLADASLRPYATGAGSLRVTLFDRRPVFLLADTAETGAGPALAFRRDLWLLWNAGPVAEGRWDHALRARLLKDRDCPFGRLWVEVYGPQPEHAGTAESEPRTVLWYAEDGSAREYRLAPGRYAPAAPPPPREDADLFERSLAAGLLRSGADGRIAMAPADLPLRRAFARAHPELLAPDDGGHDWQSGPWNAEMQRLHQALHFSATGRYLRRQVATFNARQLLAAVRWRTENSDLSGDWRADWEGVPLVLTESMPLLAGRLFVEAPHGWHPWRRVVRWPALEQRRPVRFHLSLSRSARSGERLELLVMGGLPAVAGATVLASAPRCLDARPCADRDALARWVRLEMREGATDLDLVFQPLPAEVFPDLYRYDFAHIRRIDGRLRWRDSPTAGGVPSRPASAEVTLRDREGALLWEAGQPTGAVWDLGLAALVGLDPAHAGSVAGVLARLGEHGAATVEARLTVDPRLQRTARRALLERLPAAGDVASETDVRGTERVASLIVLDADRGDILAVAGGPEPPVGIVWSDLSAFVAAVRPRRSPLWVRAWQHDGDGLEPAGSVFELVDALLLEREAGHRPQLAAALAGLSIGDLAKWPPALAHGFAADATCYPARAGGREPAAVCDEQSANDGHNVLERMRRHEDERYGLAQALRDSSSAWFAWLMESIDAALLDDAGSSGLASARALTPAALRGVRPLPDILAELGFDSPRDLDGGLLPAGLIEANDVLRASAAVLEPMSDRGRVRRAALGQGVYVTPLQLAELAAVIATGRWTPPSVLAELNGRPARDPAGTVLDIATNRIRRGMRLALGEEPLRAIFAGSRFDGIRPLLYLKTGAARLDPVRTGWNAWLAGWLEPGALPGENRRLAFACLIGPAAGPGGAPCVQLTAAWLAALAERQGDE